MKLDYPIYMYFLTIITQMKWIEASIKINLNQKGSLDHSPFQTEATMM